LHPVGLSFDAAMATITIHGSLRLVVAR